MSETTTTDHEAAIADAVDAGLEAANLRSTPLPATAVDAGGTERVVAYPRPWTPAPVEPDPADVQRMEAFERYRDHEAAKRQELLRTGAPVAETPVETTPDPAEAETQAAAEAEAERQRQLAAQQQRPGQPPVPGQAPTPPVPGQAPGQQPGGSS